MFGEMPSHGFFLRHAKNISLSNVEISSLEPDARPAFVLQDVRGAEFFRIRTAQPAGVTTFALNNVDDFSAFRCKHVPDIELDHVDKKNL